jgi:hypothetical protein
VVGPVEARLPGVMRRGRTRVRGDPCRLERSIDKGCGGKSPRGQRGSGGSRPHDHPGRDDGSGGPGEAGGWVFPGFRKTPGRQPQTNAQHRDHLRRLLGRHDTTFLNRGLNRVPEGITPTLFASGVPMAGNPSGALCMSFEVPVRKWVASILARVFATTTTAGDLRQRQPPVTVSRETDSARRRARPSPEGRFKAN